MATEVKRRRGTTVEHSTFTGAVAELTVDLTKDTVVVHDGATQGGFPLLREDFSNVPTTAPFTNISLDTAIFDTTYTETGSETQGTLYWNSDEETLSLVTNGESIELGQKVEIHVKNQTGAQINKGEVVYASGTVGASGRILVTKMIADGTVAAKRVLGVAAENIANGADGKVIKFGKLRQINTSTFSDGDILWVSTTAAGGFQNTEPVQANGEIALPIAYVVYSSASVGEIFIRVTPIDENEYQDYDAGLQDISGLTPSDSTIIVGDGTNWVAESGATARASLGLTIGTHVQAWDAQLDDIAGLTPTDGNFIVGNGTNFIAESGNTARTSLGLGTGDSPTFSGITSTGIIYTDNIDTVDITWNTSTQVWDATPSEYFNNPLFIGTSLDVDNDLEVDGYANIGTDLDVGGNSTLLGTLSVFGATTLGSTLSVTSNATVGGTLGVTGNTTLGGTLTLSGSADFNSTMNLQGNLTTQADLQDDGFSSGWSGTNWKIGADGSAEFEEMRIRGALRVYEFIAKQISTIGGSEILSIAQGRVVSAGSGTITIENVTGTPGNSFKSGDLFICQVTDINNDLESGGTGSIVKSVRGLVDAVSGNDLTVTIESGLLSDLEQGDLIVGYGSTSDADRQAIMYRNVDRSEDNLIMRLQTSVNDFSKLQAVTNTRVAFGDLKGYSGLSAETFGFFAGDNTNEHILVTDGGLFLKDGTTVLAQLTSNTFKVGDGTNFLSFNGTTFDIQTDTFNLDTTNLDISSANENIVIGTGSALMTVGKLSSVEQGIKIDSNGITNQNYWKLGQGSVQFKVGDGTNFLSFNENSGTFDIQTQAFRLDTTSSGGGIDIDSTNQTIKLEDANRVRTQVDVNSGAPTVSATSHINDTGNNVFDKDLSHTTTSFQVTNGDSIRVTVTGQLTDISTLDSDDNFQFEVRLLSSSTSGGTYTQVGSTVISQLFNGTNETDSDTVSFSYHTYGNEYFKVQVSAQSVDADLADDPQFQTTLIDVDSFPSVTRVSLDGVYVQNNDKQYAQLTRTKNELSGQIFLKNLPDSDPSISGQLYRDSSGNLKVSL